MRHSSSPVRLLRYAPIVVRILGSDSRVVQAPPPDTTISMDFTRATSFYDAPFPSEDLRKADGHVDLSKFPGQANALIIQQAVQLVSSDARGFSSTAGVFFSATAAHRPDEPARSSREARRTTRRCI